MNFTHNKPRFHFTIKLAGVPIEVHARYKYTQKICCEYLTDEPAQFVVSVSRDDLKKERKYTVDQMKREGHFLIYYLSRYLEPSALCRRVMEQLIMRDIILVHGSVMAVDGKAYLFTAKSGTGKTTHCRLWIKNVANCHILNGDKPLIYLENGKFYVSGSPWQGKENYGVNEMLPLEAICILERDKVNHIEEISLKNCYETLINQCNIPNGSGNFIKVVNMVKQLSGVKLYKLGCNMEDDAAIMSYKFMTNNK